MHGDRYIKPLLSSPDPNSINARQKSIHGSIPNEVNTRVWQQVHALTQVGLLVHSLDTLQKMGLLVIILDSGNESLTARSVLTLSAMLVPVHEVDIFDPTKLDPRRGLRIRGYPIAERVLWDFEVRLDRYWSKPLANCDSRYIKECSSNVSQSSIQNSSLLLHTRFITFKNEICYIESSIFR